MSIQTKISTIAETALPIGEQWQILRSRIEAEKDGPRVCITTGIHGDELMGQLVIYSLIERISQNPQLLRGTLDLYPMLNPLGLDLGERMVPLEHRLDMNRAFPGKEDGTPLENICFKITEDIKDADLTLDIHNASNSQSELYQVRMFAPFADAQIKTARALHPDIIWIYPDKPSFYSSLAGTLSQQGKTAFILELNQMNVDIDLYAERIVSSILSCMHSIGAWLGEPDNPDPNTPPIIHGHDELERISCETPGIYIPEFSLGKTVSVGEPLGRIISPMTGAVLETVSAPCNGLIFAQRRYSAVYPGTMIARLRKEDVVS